MTNVSYDHLMHSARSYLRAGRQLDLLELSKDDFDTFAAMAGALADAGWSQDEVAHVALRLGYTDSDLTQAMLDPIFEQMPWMHWGRAKPD